MIRDHFSLSCTNTSQIYTSFETCMIHYNKAEDNDIENIRLRTNDYELIAAQEGDYILVVLYNGENKAETSTEEDDEK